MLAINARHSPRMNWSRGIRDWCCVARNRFKILGAPAIPRCGLNIEVLHAFALTTSWWCWSTRLTPASLRWIGSRYDQSHPECPLSFLFSENFFYMLKLQAKERILAFKALLLITNLDVSLWFIFWRKYCVNSRDQRQFVKYQEKSLNGLSNSHSSPRMVQPSAASKMRNLSL